ncbi:hypothetical protein FH608_017190 [Nonomuraea phyllanthi]|uniref:Uncharacterized protein n=1 Tax=Nonomuraea phyllanthi TaxID=2219224 RepID=A0A5C4WK75_9ACTN|nr:hypothetical protein [Nonomuraea phyllanthi]KAB8194883.1 hypothetical protein FH608_017190 [Nonomuraea phyllanthi]QFY09309.1 hypothetical protein GBF35_23990 [Nonomuraea phyllanthi]
MLRVARAALFAVVPAELLLAVLFVSGVSLPLPVVAVAEAAVVAVLVLEAVTAYRLFRAARRGGADRWTALRAAYEQLVPEQVRRIVGFDLRGVISLALWVARRRHGVPDGATPVSYARAQTLTMMILLGAMVVELVGADVLLRAFGAPVGLRAAVLVADAYAVLIVLAVIAACVTRPHVVSDDEVRIRYGAFFDLRVPRERIAGVRPIRSFNESGTVKVDGDRLAVAVASQTNLILELTEPVTVVRPLGSRAEARAIRLFADDPTAALAVLRSRRQHTHGDGPVESADEVGVG